MRSLANFLFKDIILSICIFSLMVFSVVILISLDKPLFPFYIVYIILAVGAFIFFSNISFDITALFSKYFYLFSIIFLLLPIIIGQVTRGTIRWIPLGPLNIQPAEIVRPFLLVFFANYLSGKVDIKKFFKALGLLFLPVILILIQPSLGVSILTVLGFLGVVLASKFNKKYILIGIAAFLLLIPLFWKILAPYQKQRILTFLSPASDPLGAGYNSLQSTIAAGSGKFFGTGLGKGIQTQLKFLPEKQTDFIFAALAEEMGLIGAGLVLIISFILILRLIYFMERAVSPPARAYLTGFTLIVAAQIFVHVGMNLGMLPVTGLPFPLLSAGGSSLLATMIGLGIAVGAYKR